MYALSTSRCYTAGFFLITLLSNSRAYYGAISPKGNRFANTRIKQENTYYELRMNWFDDIVKKAKDRLPDGTNDVQFNDDKKNNVVEAKTPGRGVIELKFSRIKVGGFRVWLFFWLLSEAKSDPSYHFTIRESTEGIRCFILKADSDPSTHEYDGVLDFTWGDQPSPYLRVDRFDVDEGRPYPGELDILCKLLDALTNLQIDRAMSTDEKLFLFDEDSSDISDAKAKLAILALKYDC